MLRDFFKTIGSFGVYLTAFFIPALILVIWAQLNLFAALDKRSTENQSFMVETSWGMDQLGDALEESKLIRNSASIVFLSKYKLSGSTKDDLKIQPGEYELSSSMKPEAILKKLIKGNVKLYDVEIPPGQTITDVAQILSDLKLVTKEEATEALRDKSLLVTLGIPSHIPEGFFIEGSYKATRPSKPVELIDSLLKQSQERMKELLPNWRTRAKEIGFLPYDILILASIIEQESTKDEERKLVASMYHNRYRINLPLQSDEALIYDDTNLKVQGVNDAARKKPGSYNTFVSTKLPQTPICSPSAASIEAALAPADTDFLYKTAKGDGTHDFSTRLKEHIRKIKANRAKILSAE